MCFLLLSIKSYNNVIFHVIQKNSFTHNLSARFIENNKDKPFFLYFGTNDIHVPRYPHDRFRGKSDMGLRGDAILQFDWSVGEVIKALKDAGVYDNTIIIITSDNGPVVDDGYADEAEEKLQNHKPWGPFRGGKYSTFEAATRVPFIVHWTEGVEKKVSDALITQIDMLATLAELTGVEVSPENLSDSQSHLPAWLGKDLNGRDYIIGAGHTLTVSTKKWKYIEPGKGPAYQASTNIELGNNPVDQLYDLEYDKGEYDNVAGENPLVVRFLKQLLDEEKEKGMGMEL